MIRAATLTFLLSAALSLPLCAAPRLATVRIAEIYRNLASTRAMNDGLDQERQEIAKDERAIHLRKIIDELAAIYKELQQRRNDTPDDVTRKLAQTFEQKRQESQTLQQEFQLFEAEKKKEINRRMVVSMRGSLKKITETADRISKEQGYDCVFDISGNSNTGVPVILYVKGGKDITEDVVAALTDSGEPSAPPPPAGGATPPPAAGGDAPAPQEAPSPAKP